LLYVRCVIADGPVRLRVRKAKTGPVQRDMPHARLCGCLV
jgi:hypothetical protein